MRLTPADYARSARAARSGDTTTEILGGHWDEPLAVAPEEPAEHPATSSARPAEIINRMVHRQCPD